MWNNHLVWTIGLGFSLLAGWSITAMGDVDPQTALTVHNDVRTKLNQGEYPDQPLPNPALALMFWDADLASASKGYAEQCVWEHSTDRVNTGENLYASTDLSVRTPTAVQAWADEHVFYDFESRTCTAGEQCGHYTQLVWQDSLLLGCGQADCAPLRSPDGSVLFNRGSYVVCRYGTSGNVDNNHAYDTVGVNQDLLPTYTEDTQTLTLPYFLIWKPNNFVLPRQTSFALDSGAPVTFSVGALDTVTFRDEEHVPIFDVQSARLFLPNVDTLINGQWERHSAIFKYVPGTSNPFKVELTHFQ